MRTIEFRGKRRDGSWIYGSLVYSENFDTAIYFEKGKGAVKHIDWCYVAPETIGQFTGQTDDYGKKIYEGDIVLVTNLQVGNLGEKMLVQIVYDEDLACFNFKASDRERCMCVSITYISMEVIGNIYDNPELLEDGTK